MKKSVKSCSWGIILIALACTIAMCSRGIRNGQNQDTGTTQTIQTVETPEELKQFLSGPPAIRKVKDCETVKAYISKILSAQIKELKSKEKKIKDTLSGVGRPLMESFGPTEPEILYPEFSQTNVLEAGIDEADVVKTDGNFIYLSSSGELKVVSAYPPENITISAKIRTSGQEILKLKDEIYSFSGRGYYWWWFWEFPPYWSWYTPARIEKFKFNGGINREFSLEVNGMYDSARLFQGKIFIVGTSYLNLDLINYLKYAKDYDVEEILLGEGIDVYSFLPKVRFMRNTGKSAIVEEKPIAECENIYISSVTEGTGVVWIYVIEPNNIKRYAILGVSGIFSNPYVYMSKSALYVLFSGWDWDSGLSKTTIYKLSVSEGEPEFLSGIQVEGAIPSRWSGKNSLFSINEYNGTLRLALTTRSWWNQKNPDNMIFIFDEKLEKIGELRGIKPDEDIYAVRFFGDKAYIVTFRNIDPLFIADLSDPKNPKLVGELEVPGFSTYLHPVGNDKIFAIGREGRKLQASLFDVSNPKSPELITRVYLPSSWSEAETNYKAMTFFKDLVALPFYKREYKSYSCYESKDTSGFLILGLSNLNILGEATAEELCWWSEYEDYYRNCLNRYQNCPQPLRAVFIGDFIYSVMNSGINVWTKELKKIALLKF